MAHSHHKAKAKANVRVRVLTCSDSRTEETDLSGRLIRDLLTKEGHELLGHGIVTDDPAAIGARIQAAIDDSATQVVIINGGTGISPRDSTYEVVAGFLDKRIDGFGELFRHLSYREIGSAAIMSRAVAGIAGNSIIISVPGSESAVRLAMEEIILPELRHMAWLVG